MTTGGHLGDGADLTGRKVRFLDHEWTVEGLNNYGMWDIVRYETRPDGKYRIRTSIPKTRDHPHFQINHPYYVEIIDP